MPDPEPTHRFRFSLRQLFLLVTLVGVGLAVGNWVLRRVIEVRVPRAGEVSIDGESVALDDRPLIAPRIIAIVTGRFRAGLPVTATLWKVEFGIVKEWDTGFLFVTNEMGSIWKSRTIRLVLGEDRTNEGNVATLGFDWEDRYRSWWAELPWRDTKIVAKETLPCQIRQGSSRIVYVEGDRKSIVNGMMTLDEFANVNPGRYLVVSLQHN